jgi:hypothetical protein
MRAFHCRLPIVRTVPVVGPEEERVGTIDMQEFAQSKICSLHVAEFNAYFFGAQSA